MWLMCPECGADLEKKPKTGENVKHCPSCGRNWFILQTSQDKIEYPKPNGPPITLEQADKALKEAYSDNP